MPGSSQHEVSLQSSPTFEHCFVSTLQLHGDWNSGGSLGSMPGVQDALQPAQYWSFS
eukprot:CAMPEP_0175699428 /NCGR_PEP_ID=MMETSP0097-20121207/34470_1 /TAXON_ID=311494 /ORGANISM="Alexandrium monilatum, Strain CCMP3105" /LENGTH=56 /DNA_ID=CAMNT_0017006633 /DNA_START=186 /DNA_END=352 /DNA_ORIENTATION=-